MEPLLVIAYLSVFLWRIERSTTFRDTDIPARWLQAAFLAKAGAGLFLGWIYYHHYKDRYNSDTIKFFDDSGILFDTLRSDPRSFFRMLTGFGADDPSLRPYYVKMQAWLNTDVLFNDNKTVIRLNTLFRFISCGYYSVHVILINMLSFTGLYCMFAALKRHLDGGRRLLFVTVFGLPSLMLWGSGLLKDGFMLFALGLLLKSFTQLAYKEQRKGTLPLFVFSLLLLLFTKFYVIVTVLPGLVGWWLARNHRGWKSALIFLASYSAFMAAGFNVYRINDRYDLTDLLYWKQHNFLALTERLKPGSSIEIPPLEDTFAGIVKASPAALLRAIIHPTPADHPENMLVMLTAFENILFWVFLVSLILLYGRRTASHLLPVHHFCLLVSVIILTLIGLTTPVLGAMVRYKIVVQPFIVFLFISLLDAERLKRLPAFLRDRP